MEMLFPIPFLPEEIKVPFKKENTFRLRDSIKVAAFFDNGAVFPHEGKTGTTNFLSRCWRGYKTCNIKIFDSKGLCRYSAYELRSLRSGERKTSL